MTTQHILIVDDDRANVDLLKRLLESQSNITAACNGLDALQAVSEQRFDLVLLDIMMPDISGFQVLSTLRRRYDASELPVILISALTERKHVVEGLRLGANDYISKPIEAPIVLARVATQLELKALADERLQLVTKLEQANHMRNRLMKIASHDLKNPINTLNMAFRIMEDADDTDKSVLNMAQKSLNQMQSIVVEFLDMDILRDDKVGVALEAVSIEKILQDTIDTFVFAAEEKQLRIHSHITDCHIMADEKRLQQVLNNLMSNAVKYSPCGRSITVRLEPLNDTLRIHIIDEGAGIAKDEQAQLFQPFAKISTKPTAGEDSTGLGLWIAQQMIEIQNGTIGLNSDEGAGCDFWIELPIATVDAQQKTKSFDETQPLPLEMLVG